jgi:hypothetical protein
MLVGCVSCDCHPGSPFSHIGDTRCYLVCVFSFWHHSLSLCRRPLLFRQQHSLSVLRRSLARSVCSDVPVGLSRSPPPAACVLRIALNFSPQKADDAAGRPAACARRRKGPERMSTALPSTLSPRLWRHLLSSSSASLASYKVLVKVKINWPLLLKFFSCLFVWWIMLIWCMECRWRLLLGLGCTDSPKKIGRIS